MAKQREVSGKLFQVCTKCGIEKEISYFSNDKQKATGKRSSCKRCDSESRKKKIEPKNVPSYQSFVDWMNGLFS